MDALLREIYGLFGLFGIVVAGISVLIYRGAMAVINRNNAQSREQVANSVAVEITAQLARDSTTTLNMRNVAYEALQSEKQRLEKELDKAYQTIDAADRDTLLCRNDLNAVRAELKDAQKAVLILRMENNRLERELEALQAKGMESDL